MSKPKSFLMILGRRYRVYFNPQGDGWYVAYDEGDGRRRQSLGVKTRPEAEDAVRKLDEYLAGRVTATSATTEQGLPKLVTPARVTWVLLEGQFLANKTGLGRAKKTVVRYKAALDAFGRHLTRQGLQYVDQVTLRVLEGYPAYRMGVEHANKVTVFDDALVIKGMLKWAAKPSRGMLTTNPALDWETSEPLTPKRPCYTREEVGKLEAGVRPWLREVVTMLAWTGMRIDELVNLKWQDVDLEKRVINIRIRDDWRPKGKADRTVPMFPKVEAIIGARPIGEHVIRGPQGGKLKQEFCLRALKADQRKLGLPVRDLHGFRRFFATEMLHAGVDIDTVRQWGGWKSLETMLRYLADVSETDSVKAMEMAAEKLAAS